MKKLLSFFLLGLFALNSCQQEEPNPAAEDVTFALSISASSTGRIATELPPNVAAEVTLVSESTSDVMHKKLTIQKMGNSYISDPVSLMPGRYTLTDFKITNQSSEVLYATPKKGSKLANIVSIALPYSFSVSRNDVRNIAIEVLPVGTQAPEDFGYAAFNIGVVNPMQIAVFAFNNGKLELTSAKAQIRRGGNIAEDYHYDLNAKVNVLPFKGETNVPYNLTITKEGFKVYEKVFTYDDLIDELNGKPWNIILESGDAVPAVTFVPAQGYFSMWLHVSGKGTIYLDWGNNEVEVLDFDVDPENETGTAFFYRDREYTEPAPQIRITGDVHLFSGLALEAEVLKLDVSDAKELTNLTVTGSSLHNLDLSENERLDWLILEDSRADNFILPSQHQIRYINIGTYDGAWPAEPQLKEIANNIYDNTVMFNTESGNFITRSTNISQQTKDILQGLVDGYGWNVEYP
jgi:hypothetical protein